MAAPTDQPAAELLDLYEQMAVIRRTEKAAHDLFLAGLVKGTTHLAAGHEAVAVGASAALRPDDYVFATYRGHHHAIARGATPEECLAELMSRATGVCKAKGGSMHLTKADARHARLVRDRRRAPADGGRRGVVGAAARHRPGRGRVLRRRRDEHRRVPRGAQPGRGVEAAGALRLREQPLHGVHADRRGDRGAEPGRRPGAGVRHPGRDHRRQRRAGRARRGGAGGRAGPGRRRADRDRGADLPALRAQPHRPGQVPAGGGGARAGWPATRCDRRAGPAGRRGASPNRRSPRPTSGPSGWSPTRSTRRRPRRTPTRPRRSPTCGPTGGAAWRT